MDWPTFPDTMLMISGCLFLFQATKLRTKGRGSVKWAKGIPEYWLLVVLAGACWYAALTP